MKLRSYFLSLSLLLIISASASNQSQAQPLTSIAKASASPPTLPKQDAQTATAVIKNPTQPLALSPTPRPAAAPTTAANNASAMAETAVRNPGVQFGNESGWEIYLAGGGSFWSHQDSALSVNDILTLTPNQPLPQDKLAIRQSFASGGRLVAGLVKNINDHSALEFAYAYGANNFKVTALENGSNVGISEIQKGMTRSLGMRSHIASLNYRYSLVNNDHARFYLTGGVNLTVFTPNNGNLNKLFGQIPGFDANDFKQKPGFRSVAAPGINVGAGLIVKMNDTVGLRFDVRDYMTFTKRVKGSAELKTGEKLEVSLFGNTLHNLVPTFGIVFTPK